MSAEKMQSMLDKQKRKAQQAHKLEQARKAVKGVPDLILVGKESGLPPHRIVKKVNETTEAMAGISASEGAKLLAENALEK